jgi:glutaredoxin 3
MKMILKLYYYDSCPFCQIVLKIIKDLNLLVDFKNIHQDEKNLQKLLKDTGRKTVPCLYIDENPLFESLDIVAWLKKNADNLEKVQNGNSGSSSRFN